MPTYRNRDGIPVPVTQLSNEDLLSLPATDRGKALAELARQGTQLAVLVVDVSAPCPGLCEGSGRVTLDDGTKIDCHQCDGTGTVDGRSKCLVEGCLDFGQPLSPTLTGWECARVHAHGARLLPLDVEPPGYRGPNPGRGPRVELEIIDEVSPVADAVFAKIAATMPKPQMDADPYPWDEPETASPWIDRLAEVIGGPLPLPEGTDAEKLRELKERLLAPSVPIAPAIEGELRATALVSALNTKLAALGVNARAELTPGAITITISGDTSLADVEAIAELLGQAVSSWPGERPRVTGRVETDEARFVTPADLAAVVNIDIPESVAAVYREAGEKMDAEIAKLILGPPTSTVEDIVAEMAWHEELGDTNELP